MHEERASATAQLVALARALGDLRPRVPSFSDPMAARFLAPPYRMLYDIARRGFWGALDRVFGELLGAVTVNQFRTVVLDQAIAAAPPFTQLVILGAGLDGRAWRLSSLADKQVFEVDHPSTQAWKRQRAHGLTPKARALHFVPVDFERDDLASCLDAAGHDPSAPTFWLWEGVVYYLEREAIAATMQAAARRSAPGSRLALTYMTKVNDKALAAKVLASIGEPMRSRFPPEGLASFAARLGWQTVSDSGLDEWRRRMTPQMKLSRLAVGPQWYERVWVGRG
jgi:methyltransferase (TIGR00027 family)